MEETVQIIETLWTYKPLTCTKGGVIIPNRDRTSMEQSARKLIQEREQIAKQVEKLAERTHAINTALEIIELRLSGDPEYIKLEEALASDAFRESTMPQCCEIVFAMYGGWLDKHQMEYLLTVGGYRFEAKDPTNSVDVTLRRMAEKQECEVDKRGGYHGNRYRRLQKTTPSNKQ